MWETATWTFSISFMIDDINLPGGVRFEELRALPDDLVENRVAQVRDGRESDVIHQVIAEVIADPLVRNTPRMAKATMVQMLRMRRRARSG